MLPFYLTWLPVSIHPSTFACPFFPVLPGFPSRLRDINPNFIASFCLLLLLLLPLKAKPTGPNRPNEIRHDLQDKIHLFSSLDPLLIDDI